MLALLERNYPISVLENFYKSLEDRHKADDPMIVSPNICTVFRCLDLSSVEH